MSKILNLLTFMLVAGFSLKAFSLESVDVLKVNILKAYDKNILVLDRGAEDGIFKRDHIKVTNNSGFIARGICIKSSMQTSHWKIYRVVRPQLVSKDDTYDLRSINQSKIPKDLSKFAKVDFTPYFNYGDKDVNKQLELQQERIAKYDLPEKVSDTDNFKTKERSGLEQFVESNFKEEDLVRDFSNLQVDVFASPISWQTRDKQEETHYGMRIHNIGQKYQYQINAVEKRLKLVDPVSESTYRTKSTYYDAHLQINRVTENMSLVSFISYEREKIGNFYYPHKYYQLGFIGFRYHFWEVDPRDRFVDLTYTPTFDTFEYTDPDNNGMEEKIGVRHLLSLRLYSHFTKYVRNRTELTYAPYSNTEKGFGIDRDDSKSFISTEFSWDLGNDFWFDYSIDYTKDEFRGEEYNIRDENTIQTIRFRYSWNS